jgi:hypothetical protein
VSTGYRILVMLHLICVIGGFGAVAYNGLYASLAQRRPGAAGSSAVLEVNTLVSGLAELLIYAALVFGVGAVTASNSQVKFSQGWEASLRTGTRPPQLTALAALEKRVALGWGVFNLVVVAAVYLMVFKPGS